MLDPIHEFVLSRTTALTIPCSLRLLSVGTMTITIEFRSFPHECREILRGAREGAAGFTYEK